MMATAQLIQKQAIRDTGSSPARPYRAGGTGRWRKWRRVHGRAILWLSPALLVAALVQGINMSGSPQRIDDEGTYTAQAWAILNLGELAHYTYWYDHPPLGWIQIAGYAWLTDAFGRWDVAVMAGREAVLVATVISAGLLWMLARRTGLGRGWATVAALLFAVSPLAVQFHRTVYLDNIATPWLLGALVLASSRKHQLAGFLASAAAFGIAVLSKETYLLALPLVIWVMFRHSWPATRRYTLAVAGTLLVLIGGSYLLLATIKGELIPGADRVSLYEGVAFQLSSRGSSGSVLDAGSLISRTLGMWWQLDPVFIVTGLAAALGALFLKRVRPFAAMLVFLVLFMFRPGGYLPVPYVIMMLPLAALCIAGIGSWAIRQRRSRSAGKSAGVILTVLTLAAAITVPLWTVQLRGLLDADLDAPMVNAQGWVADNVERSNRIIVDDAMWVDLLQEGFPRENVIWYYKIDTDAEVMAQSPNGWRDSDYIVTTDSMRTFPDNFPQVAQALQNSTVVASFGSGTQKVDVRKIHDDGIAAFEQARSARSERLTAAGSALATNPALSLQGQTAELLDVGQVDARIIIALGQKAAAQSLTVSDFPTIDGEDGTMRRQVLVSAMNGQELPPGSDGAAAVQKWFEALEGPFAAAAVQQTDGGVLATWSFDAPADLLPAAG